MCMYVTVRVCIYHVMYGCVSVEPHTLRRINMLPSQATTALVALTNYLSEVCVCVCVYACA